MFYGPLCAALPTLECGILPGITLAEFDELASKELSGKKFKELISWDDAETSPRSAVYRKMREFDDFLKLRIAESRREKLGVYDPLPEPDELDSDVDYAFPNAAAANDPLERERLVDLIRWRKIDDLEVGHEMDFAALCCYRLRLASLEKFHTRSVDAGNMLFEESVEKISSQMSNM